MSRKEFSRKTKRDAFMRAAGNCEGCGAKLTVGKMAYDHVNPDGLTGEPTLENCEVLCKPCHAVKTQIDVANIARAKRRQDSHLGIRPPTTMKGQGFRKAPPQQSATRKIEKLTIAWKPR